MCASEGLSPETVARGAALQRQVAVALEYMEDEDRAPRLVAKGFGAVAEEIQRIAADAGVDMVSDPGLAAVLSRLELGREIPPELYEAVARILSYIYAMNELVRRGEP